MCFEIIIRSPLLNCIFIVQILVASIHFEIQQLKQLHKLKYQSLEILFSISTNIIEPYKNYFDSIIHDYNFFCYNYAIL